ncbi:BLUF domain-containing protein [Sansalvadorimonas sp. 2012CJ34-2]|uniref:BLUF domain-containing protein n=1 Tax=Parendozoicomonas callyspongiae TaxID=2942213 RepID=A0ABT0PE20_9GAMM|nr:BLUF domain-containing protein [Sansalvadorimonas sp. 2012CJ34-2]MCL6269628.1 BLUF domain-containing protein [Sansalvadorimonas sp. 2012CJ34-2]
MSDQLFNIVYSSTAQDLFDEQALEELLKVARKNNKANGVTGMLLYSDGVFMQVLEGPRDKVQWTFDHINKDPRHHSVIILSQSLIEERQFGEWEMGFKSSACDELAEISGFSEFMHQDFDASELFSDNPTNAQKLLISFRKNMR